MSKISMPRRHNRKSCRSDQLHTQAEVFFQLANRGANALDSVRRNGHQQFGRLEKSLALGTLARFLR